MDRRLLVGVCLGAMASGCLAPPDEAEGIEASLADGTPDPDAEGARASVILRSGGARCTGTHITPQWILTAEHCFVGRPWESWGAGYVDDSGGRPSVTPFNACVRHPNARGGPTSTDCNETDGVTSQAHDLALLHADPTAPLHTILVPGGAPFDEFPFNTVPVRSLRPPPFCAADAEVEARGFGVAPTGHVTAQFTLADVTSGSYFAEDFMLVAARAPAAFVQGDSGGGVAVAGLGLVGVISGGEPVSGVVPVTRAAPVGAVSNREWIWSVLDASGSCALGSLGPCVLREPAPSTGTICGDGHCTGTEAPSTCPTDCDIWAEEAPFHDTDGDGLPDVRDLCPQLNAFDPRATIADGNHADADLDGIGDDCESIFSCDPCSGDADADLVPDNCDNCPVANTDQADCDGDGLGDACSPDVDGDRRLDVCGLDNCVADADTTPEEAFNPGQENCNAEVEALLSIAALGDACDPTPCGETTLLTRRDRRGPAGRDVYAVTDAVEIDARAFLSAPGSDVRAGMRFCPCAAARTADSPDERRVCEGAAFGCTRNDALLYDDGEQVDGAWREVTMLWPSPDPDPAGEVDPLAPIAILTARGEVVESFASTTGPFIPDLRARWLLEDVDRPRWNALFDETTANTPLPGVMWTHAPGPTPIDTDGDGTLDFFPPDFVGNPRTLASHFWSGTVEPPTFLFRTPIPCAARLAPFLGASGVGSASFPEAFIGLPGIPGAGGLCARAPGSFLPWLGFGDGFIDATGLIPIEPPAPGDPPRWIAAVEPTEQLGATSLRYALVAPVGGALVDTVSWVGGALQLDSKCGPNGCACPQPPCAIVSGLAAARTSGGSAPPVGSIAVLSASRETLWLVGEPTSALDASPTIVEVDLADDARIVLPLDETLGTPLAATYLPAADRLVVLDEIARTTGHGRSERRVREVRLSFVTPGTGALDVIATWRRMLPTDRFALAPSADGSLYLAASGHHGPHVVVRFRASADGLEVLGVARGARPILANAAHASRLGLSLGVAEHDGRAGVVGYRTSSLTPPRRHFDDFDDCF